MDLWGFDFVIVAKGDADNKQVGVATCAFEGATFDAAATRLRITRPKVPIPDNLRVAGVRPHGAHMGHLFGPNAPCAVPGWTPVGVGPAVNVAAAYERMAFLRQQEDARAET